MKSQHGVTFADFTAEGEGGYFTVVPEGEKLNVTVTYCDRTKRLCLDDTDDVMSYISKAIFAKEIKIL